MFEIDPESIAMQMRGKDGMTYTCYWNCSRDDRATMVGAMQDDDILDFLRANKEIVQEIIMEEGDDGDGLCETDTEADSEG